MATNYPTSADSFDTIASDKKTSDAVGGRTHRAMHNDLGDAIEAIEAELGVNPSGSDATVVARLAAIEAGTNLAAGSIDNSHIASGAAIAVSKLAGHPTTTTDNAVTRFDGTAGNTQNSGVIISDGRAVTGVASLTDNETVYPTVGADLGDGISLTQNLTGLTIGAVYVVAAASGTLTAATLDGATLTCTTNTTAFKATATSHTVVGTSGSAPAITVTLMTPRATTVAPLIAGARVLQHNTNVAVGSTPVNLTAGIGNSAVGYLAQTNLTAGSFNTAVGREAQTALISGGYNTAVGRFAQTALTYGAYNTAVGSGAQDSLTTGRNNVAVGYVALQAATSGTSNVAVGDESLFAVTDGIGNVSLGHTAGRAFTTGTYNTAVGYGTGYTGATTATISGSVCIGTNSSGTAAQATADNQFVLGTSSHDVQVPGTLKVTGNVGFYNTAPAAKPTVTGSRGSNAALASLLTALAGLGLLTDSSS